MTNARHKIDLLRRDHDTHREHLEQATLTAGAGLVTLHMDDGTWIALPEQQLRDALTPDNTQAR
jgi:hypothetical protein